MGDSTVNFIPFNKAYSTGGELSRIDEVIKSSRTSGNGRYSKLCQEFFEKEYEFKKCLLTTSCTDALEMASILLNIQPGDEVIMPSYTFVSTANAFVLRGAKIIFADSGVNNPNIDTEKIEQLITPKTKCLVLVHYAGVACAMDQIMALVKKHDLFLVEDAAQAIDNYYIWPDGKKQFLGSFGHLSAFSFHETKNISSGEGGMLVINDPAFVSRAEIIWEKGTNRSAFFRGEVDKYGWVDMGSSFLPSDMIAAFLYEQLTHLKSIQKKRIDVWNAYDYGLANLPVQRATIPDFSGNNGHIFFLICNNLEERTQLIRFMKDKGIQLVFHYQSLHKSQFHTSQYEAGCLPQSDHLTDCLVRLPLFPDLSINDVERVVNGINEFYTRVANS